MLAAYVEEFNDHDPLASLVVGEQPEPPPPPAGWTRIKVRAASLNHHDLWSLRGVGLRRERLPMILGCDAAGVDVDGQDVIVHSMINSPGWRGAELADPQLTMLSELHPGTFAEEVLVPRANIIPKPEGLTFEEAACLPTAWLTAYRMLFVQAALRPGQTVLIQGAGGGLSTALVVLGHAAGLRVWVTSRSARKRAFAGRHGADMALEAGARVPERVDAVMDSVGAATWEHSLKSLERNGTMVVAGGTSGYHAVADVAQVFARQLRIVGSVMGTFDDFNNLLRMCHIHDIHPPIDQTFPLKEATRAFEALHLGNALGKIVICP